MSDKKEHNEIKEYAEGWITEEVGRRLGQPSEQNLELGSFARHVRSNFAEVSVLMQSSQSVGARAARALAKSSGRRRKSSRFVRGSPSDSRV